MTVESRARETCRSRRLRSALSRAVAREGRRDTIEIHEAEGAFERLEPWLRARGFFAPGGETLVADLYLGYGLSSTIRRHALARSAGAVPAAACRLHRPARGLCCQ